MGILDCGQDEVFPYFSGKNPRIWVERFEQVFSTTSTPDDERLKLVEPYFKGRVVSWFDVLRRVIDPITWEYFVRHLLLRFGGNELRRQMLAEGWNIGETSVAQDSPASVSELASDIGDSPATNVDEHQQATFIEENFSGNVSPVASVGKNLWAAVDKEHSSKCGDDPQAEDIIEHSPGKPQVATIIELSPGKIDYLLLDRNEVMDNSVMISSTSITSSHIKDLQYIDVETRDISEVVVSELCFDPGISKMFCENSCCVKDWVDKFKHPCYDEELRSFRGGVDEENQCKLLIDQYLNTKSIDVENIGCRSNEEGMDVFDKLELSVRADINGIDSSVSNMELKLGIDSVITIEEDMKMDVKNLVTGMKLNETLESFKPLVMNVDMSCGHNEFHEIVTCFDPGILESDFRSSNCDTSFKMRRASSVDSHFNFSVNTFDDKAIFKSGKDLVFYSRGNEKDRMDIDGKLVSVKPADLQFRVAGVYLWKKVQAILELDSRISEAVRCYDPGICVCKLLNSSSESHPEGVEDGVSKSELQRFHNHAVTRKLRVFSSGLLAEPMCPILYGMIAIYSVRFDMLVGWSGKKGTDTRVIQETLRADRNREAGKKGDQSVLQWLIGWESSPIGSFVKASSNSLLSPGLFRVLCHIHFDLYPKSTIQVADAKSRELYCVLVIIKLEDKLRLKRERIFCSWDLTVFLAECLWFLGNTITWKLLVKQVQKGIELDLMLRQEDEVSAYNLSGNIIIQSSCESCFDNEENLHIQLEKDFGVDLDWFKKVGATVALWEYEQKNHMKLVNSLHLGIKWLLNSRVGH